MQDQSILVIGKGKVAFSVLENLFMAGHGVTFYTDDQTANTYNVRKELEQIVGNNEFFKIDLLESLPVQICHQIVVIITDDAKEVKRSLIQQLESRLDKDTPIAVNLEATQLDELQVHAKYAHRIVGLNWVYPAQTTFFLEIIANNKVDQKYVALLQDLGQNHWGKDPYIVNCGFSIRARLFAAMVREAFFLVENDIASVESVDRACRNDAGFYLPFAGNFRYMDLMGVYSYGMVMKQLNRELSKSTEIPPFMKDITAQGGTGMDNGVGFYSYSKGEDAMWNYKFNVFSEEIRALISKYRTIENLPNEKK